jgi:GTP-binding protein
VSKQPGKTRSINCYRWIDAKKILVDLPGYGFAKVAREERERWSGFLNLYFKTDTGLQAALILLDSKLGPTESDIEAIRFLSLNAIPVIFIVTKADQLKNQSERARRKKEVSAKLAELGASDDQVIWISIKTKEGIEHLRSRLR